MAISHNLTGSFFGPSTLVELLAHRARHTPDTLAYLYLTDGDDKEESLTYSELDRRARAVAATLARRGIREGRALLLYPAGLDYLAAFFGCLYAGVTAVPAYPPRMNRSLERIQAIAADADARVALSTDAVWTRVERQVDQAPELRELFWLSTDGIESGIEDEWTAPTIDGDSLAFLQYTSGSTGSPKGVMLTHANLLHNGAIIQHGFEVGRRSVGIFWLPSYHDMGLIGGILEPLYAGCLSVLMSPVAFLQRPIRWLKTISKYRGTISGGPNFAYELCLNKTTPEQRESLDLSSWRVAFNGAEPVRAETIERFTETFAPHGFRPEAFYPCYGLAEATLIVSGGRRDDRPVIRGFDAEGLAEGDALQAQNEWGEENEVRRLVGSGQDLPDQRIVIVDPQTHRRCPADEVGEIWVQGPSVAAGYWNRPEETAQTFGARLADTDEGPFLRTGDLGLMDEGELFVTGRMKDVIIIRGRNYYPQDVELTVEKSHESVRAGSVAAFAYQENGAERLAVVCEIERRQADEPGPVLEAIRNKISGEHELAVDAVVLVRHGSMTKTSSGKIQRRACNEALFAGELQIIAEWWGAKAGKSDVPAPKSAGFAAHATNGHAHANGAAKSASHAGTHGVAKRNGAAAANGRASHAPSATPSQAEPESGEVSSPRTMAEAITPEDKQRIVLDEVRRIAKERAVRLTLDTNITELGLDSLERIEILAALEDRFGGRFPEELLAQMETCRQVLEGVDKHLGSGSGASTSTDEIPTANYRFDCFPEYVELRSKLELLETTGMGMPFFNEHERVATDTTQVGGQELVNFAGYNYVGMSGDREVARAAKAAIDRYGTSVSASRLVSGEKPIHGELERAIAEFLGVEDSIVFVGGHSTNETVIGHLFGAGDLILHDALAHNSIVQGCILSGARRRPFRHNDWQEVDRILEEIRGQYRRVLIVIEGVYSMDGDYPNLPRFIEVKKRHKALLMIDEAHSLGVLGETGRGIGEHFGVDPEGVDLWMGTLSKSLGSCGGYIAGCREVVEYLKYNAPGFVFSVGMTPANAGAALAALRVLEREPERVRTLRARSRLFLDLARRRGLNTGMSEDSAVVPIILGNTLHCLQVSRAMRERGINVQPILYPAVEESAARLRFFINSTHSEKQIQRAVDILCEELERIDPAYLAHDHQGSRGMALASVAEDAAVREPA